MKQVMNNDEKFEQQVKASLDAHVNALDADTRKRLTDIRLQALKAQTINKNTPLFAWPNINSWMPSGALAKLSLCASP